MQLQLNIDISQHVGCYRAENNIDREIKLTDSDRLRLAEELEDALAHSKFFADLFDVALERSLQD